MKRCAYLLVAFLAVLVTQILHIGVDIAKNPGVLDARILNRWRLNGLRLSLTPTSGRRSLLLLRSDRSAVRSNRNPIHGKGDEQRGQTD